MSRSQFITRTSKQTVWFSDLTRNLTKNPLTGQLAVSYNEAAVAGSIYNIVRTGFYDRPFDPGYGAVDAQLFEMVDQASADTLKTQVTQAIANRERRARSVEVTVTPFVVEMTFKVSVLFSTVNSLSPYRLDVILERVR